MGRLVHRPRLSGFEVCVQYDHLEGPGRPLPLFHGPPLDPALAHPFFPGTVVYARRADCPCASHPEGGHYPSCPITLAAQGEK